MSPATAQARATLSRLRSELDAMRSCVELLASQVALAEQLAGMAEEIDAMTAEPDALPGEGSRLPRPADAGKLIARDRDRDREVLNRAARLSSTDRAARPMPSTVAVRSTPAVLPQPRDRRVF